MLEWQIVDTPETCLRGWNFKRITHDDVIKWKHFPRYWPFVWGIYRSPVNSPHKGQWCGALVFSLICASINAWVNNREAGDLRRHRAHYDVIVMWKNTQLWINTLCPSDAIWRHSSWSILTQVTAYCQPLPALMLFVIDKIQWHSSKRNFLRDTSAPQTLKLARNYLSDMSFINCPCG